MATMFDRWYAGELRERLKRPFVHLVFGARQTGKSTLLRSILPPETISIDLSDPEERSRHLARPGEFAELCRALPTTGQAWHVFVDEAQAVPTIFDAVQHLYDTDRDRWRFVLCGSSMRKLRTSAANLLPGRSFMHRLYPLVLAEHPATVSRPPYAVSPVPLSWPDNDAPATLFPAWDLEARLAHGALPGIVAADEEDRISLLRAYALVHLEEEIRREALVKEWGSFLRFLQFASVESGKTINYSAVSQETGISLQTVKNHYQLLEDMFVGYRVPAYTVSQRKKLLSTPKFLFFDLGVRHAAAGLWPSPETVQANPGPLFEQWVGTELWKRLQYLGEGQLYHQRTRDGAEVDFIVEYRSTLTPIEVKWTEHPGPQDARHLLSFIGDNAGRAERGYVVCRCPRPLQIHEKVTALPWFCL